MLKQDISEEYEYHGIRYLIKKFPDAEINRLGVTTYGINKDAEIIFNEKRYEVEIKGSQLLDKNGKYRPRWNRVKLRDVDWKDPADFFLFIFDVSQLGIISDKYAYKFVAAKDVLELVINREAAVQSIPISKLAYLKEAELNG